MLGHFFYGSLSTTKYNFTCTVQSTRENPAFRISFKQTSECNSSSRGNCFQHSFIFTTSLLILQIIINQQDKSGSSSSKCGLVRFWYSLISRQGDWTQNKNILNLIFSFLFFFMYLGSRCLMNASVVCAEEHPSDIVLAVWNYNTKYARIFCTMALSDRLLKDLWNISLCHI